MKPVTPNALSLPLHIRMKDAVSTMLAFGGRARLLQRFHPAVEQGIKLDAAICYGTLRTDFFNSLRMGFVLLVGPAAIGIWLNTISIYSNSPWLLLIFMVPSCFGMHAIFGAFENRYSNRQFEKGGWEGGFKILRNWTIEFPELSQFMLSNRIAESFSIFEFDLVQNFVVAKRRMAHSQKT